MKTLHNLASAFWGQLTYRQGVAPIIQLEKVFPSF